MRNVFVLVAMLSACAADPGKPPGGGGGSGSGSGSGDMTVQSFIEQLVTKNCHQAFSCMAQYPTTTGSTFADDFGTSEADCLATDDDYAARDQLAQKVAAGTMTFDAAEATACLANMAFPATCSDFFTTYAYPDACWNALSGNVADGGTCISDFECTGDNSDCEMDKCTPSSTS